MGLVVRATVIYFFLWLLARGMGKRELVLSTLAFWVVVMSYWRGASRPPAACSRACPW